MRVRLPGVLGWNQLRAVRLRLWRREGCGLLPASAAAVAGEVGFTEEKRLLFSADAREK